MAGFLQVRGVAAAVDQLNREAGKVKGLTRKAIIKCALEIKRDAVIRAPIDTGNLRSSAFCAWGSGSQSSGAFQGDKAADLQSGHTALVNKANASLSSLLPEAIVGFTANYALYVHEDGQRRNWKGVKFLERAITENIPLLRAILRDTIKI